MLEVVIFGQNIGQVVSESREVHVGCLSFEWAEENPALYKVTSITSLLLYNRC